MIINNWPRKKLILSTTIILSIILLLLVNQLILHQANWPDTEVSHRVLKHSDIFEELWVQSDIFSRGEGISATENRLFILASLKKNEGYNLLVFDGVNGELLWSIPDKDSISTLYATPSILYTADYSGPSIIAYDAITGEKMWKSKSLPARNVSSLYVDDNLIYASSSHDIYHLLRGDTGEVIATFEQLPTTTAIQALYTELSSDIDRIKPEYFEEGATFTENIKFVRNMDGRIKAINRQTGDMLWQTEDRVVSNVVPTETLGVFLLTKDGKLSIRDLQSGKMIGSIVFDPSPFIVFDSKGNRPYHIVVDENEKMLYVMLGDSWQLFAFKLINPR